MISKHSKVLSNRSIQPGSYQWHETTEEIVFSALKSLLGAEKYRIERHPRDLSHIFGGSHGIVPDVVVESLVTGRKIFLEAKRQQDKGNAEERSFKHHTVRFVREIEKIYPDYEYHPFITIWCEKLAVNPRYTEKIAFLIEPSNYLLWKDYDRELFNTFMRIRCKEWID